MRFLVGKLLARRYRIIRTLAKGGFGQTYIAEDTQRPGNPRCLVKQLKPDSRNFSALKDTKRLFQTEAEVLEALGNHDQIPQLLAFFDENREFFLIQELVEGNPLTHELKPGKPWSELEVCQLLHEVLGILVFIHGYHDRHHQGIIHRDIKPDNIIRRRRDEKPVLVDFGSVKQVRTQLAQNQNHSAITINVGTPGYMPAEQARGSPRLNSDLYALGVIGIQAITGIAPNKLPEDPETGELLWRSQARISDELATILTQMTRYSFRDRYQTAQAVIDDLEPLLKNYVIASAQVEPPPTDASTGEQPLPASVDTQALPDAQPTISSPALSAASAELDAQEALQVTRVSPLLPEPADQPTPGRSQRDALWNSVTQSPQRWLGLGVSGAIAVLALIAAYTFSTSQRQLPASVSPAAVNQSNRDRQTLDQAIRMAKGGNNSLKNALQTIQGIPSNSPLYDEAQKQAFVWQATILQTFLRSEVPKQSQELSNVIDTTKPKVEQLDSDKITISYDSSSNAKLSSKEGLRILTAAFMQRLRGNRNEKIPSEYTRFNQLIVVPEQGKQQAVLTAADWDSYVNSGAKDRRQIYQKVQITNK